MCLSEHGIMERELKEKILKNIFNAKILIAIDLIRQQVQAKKWNFVNRHTICTKINEVNDLNLWDKVIHT